MSQPENALAADRLRGLEPIDKLTQASYRDLLGQTSFRRLPPGAKLFTEGEEDDWSVYLLDGDIELQCGEDRRRVSAGSQACHRPLDDVRPRKSSARAVSECTIARVPTSLLDVLARESTPQIEVSEIVESQVPVQDQLMVELYEAYANDEMVVPSLPDIAIRIRRAVEDPDVDARSIERIVTADPVVAARLVQVANSAVYAGASRVESCRDAVTRLGFSTTREVVTSVVLKQLFATDSPMLKQMMDELWHHCTRVAAISFQLAKALRGFSPDRALLAGLIHDVGALPLIAAAQNYRGGPISAEVLSHCIESLRGQLGAMVLRRWDFPEDLVTVALEAEDWTREGHSSADYCDLVIVAQLFSFVGTPQFSTYPQVATLPAFQRLTAGRIDVEETLAILDDAEQDIAELQRVLSA